MASAARREFTRPEPHLACGRALLGCVRGRTAEAELASDWDSMLAVLPCDQKGGVYAHAAAAAAAGRAAGMPPHAAITAACAATPSPLLLAHTAALLERARAALADGGAAARRDGDPPAASTPGAPSPLALVWRVLASASSWGVRHWTAEAAAALLPPTLALVDALDAREAGAEHALSRPAPAACAVSGVWALAVNAQDGRPAHSFRVQLQPAPR